MLLLLFFVCLKICDYHLKQREKHLISFSFPKRLRIGNSDMRLDLIFNEFMLVLVLFFNTTCRLQVMLCRLYRKIVTKSYFLYVIVIHKHIKLLYKMKDDMHLY